MYYPKLIEQKRQQLFDKDKKYTIAYVSNKVGITPMTYYNFKFGKVDIGYKTFIKLLIIVEILTIDIKDEFKNLEL